jgi:formylglycine-generating enzyme
LLFSSICVAAENPNDLFAQGYDLFMAGKYEQARDKFQQGIAEDPTNALALFYLGEAYRGLNDMVTAKRCYEASLKLDPNSKVAEEARKRLGFLSGDAAAQGKGSAPRPGEVMKDPTTGMEFVFVKGGCFQMGDTFRSGDEDERPVHEVCVDDFWIGKYEVTQAQWQQVMGNNPAYFKRGGNYPVEQVNWGDTQAYIDKLSAASGKRYRLPTEAEWEYAARSGGKQEKWAGTSNEGELGEYAWYNANSEKGTHPVGQKKPNRLGLYDMSGNVWEWCQDWYDKGYYGKSPRDNPKGPENGELVVLRGGGWSGDASSARASNRYGWFNPTSRVIYGGIRLVLSPR